MLKKLQKWYYAAIFEGEEDNHRQARLLNLITVGGAVVAFLMLPLLALTGQKRLVIYLLTATVFFAFLALQFILRRGRVKATAIAIVALVFVGITAVNLIHGTIHNPSIGMYILVVILAGQFFNWRGILISITFTVAAILAIAAAEFAGVLTRPDFYYPSIEWITYSIILLLISFLSVYNSELTQISLKKARSEIARREEAEKDLNILTKAVEQSPESIVITDLDGKIEYVNPSFTKVTGYTFEEVRGENPRVLKTDQTPAETHEVLWKNLTQGKEWRGEFVNRKKDGSVYIETALISPIFAPDGKAIHYLAIKQDITEQKKIEEALSQTTELYQLLSENISDVIWVLDLTEGKFRFVSPSVERLRGFSVDEVLAQSIAEALTPESLQALTRELPVRIEAFQKGQIHSSVDVVAQPRKDGSIVWTETTTSFQVNKNTGHLEVYGVSREITERKRTQDLINLRLELLELSRDTTLDGFLETALDKIAAYAGSEIAFYHFVEADQKTLCLQAWSTRTMREYCKAEGKGMHYPIDDAGVWVDCVRERRPIIHNDYATLETRKGLPPGHAPLIRELVVPVYRGERLVAILGVGNKLTNYTDENVESVSYLADVVWEISRRKQAEQNLQEAQSRLTLLSQNLEDAGLIVYSRDAQDESHFEYMSQSMEELTGVKVEDAMRDANVFTHHILPEYRQKIRALLKKSAKTQEKFRVEIRQRHAVSGEVRWLLLTFTPRKRPDGSTVWYGFQMDITDRKKNEQALENANEQLRQDMQKIELLQDELRDLTLRDPLTGLFNRRYLTETLPREIARARREGSSISFVMADIDHFKMVNDTHGHQVGDEFLVAIAGLMVSNARESDILCRFGGEEFLMILPGAKPSDAAARSNDLRQKIENLTIPNGGRNLKVSMSFGVAAFPEHGTDVSEIVALSDKALYRSKAEGRNRVTIWQGRPESNPVLP